MNIKTLTLACKLLPKKKSIMLKGVHGIGKTEWVKSMAKKWKLKLVIWHASHAADATDITGMPKIIKETIIWYDKKGEEHQEEHEVTATCPPKWMLQKEPVLLLLDEINRGLSIAMNAIMQLTNDQTYDDISLPAGSRIFACINPEDNGKYDVSSLDPAQLSRFAVYEFNPSSDEWIEWAITAGVHPVVISFIKAHPEYLDPYTLPELAETCVGQDAMKLPDRRAWECVSDTYKEAEKAGVFEEGTGILDMTEIFAGLIGLGAADKFMAFVADQNGALNPAEVMEMNPIDTEIHQKLLEMCSEDIPSVTGFIGSCQMILETRLVELKKNSATSKKWAKNFYELISHLQPDAKMAALATVVVDAIKRHKDWALTLCKIEPKFKDLAWSAVSSKKKVY
jgi:hypothetical protein